MAAFVCVHRRCSTKHLLLWQKVYAPRFGFCNVKVIFSTYMNVLAEILKWIGWASPSVLIVFFIDTNYK